VDDTTGSFVYGLDFFDGRRILCVGNVYGDGAI